jgi:hypothetical protein
MSDIDQPTRDLYIKFGQAVRAVDAVRKTKTADTGKYKYTYADLGDTLDAIRDACDDLNLAVSQPIVVNDGIMVVTTLVIDTETGASISFPGPGVPLKGDPQAAGSAITYFRRYALTSLFSLKTPDDDGAAANRAATQPGQRTGAEREIRELVKKMSDEMRSEFQVAFKEQFHSTLTSLPESAHGDALGFTKSWISDHE